MAPRNVCTKCGQAAKQICSGCKGCPTGEVGTTTVVTWSCSAECQKQHHPTHKEDCKDAKARRALYRAAETAYQVFIILRHASYRSPFGRVEKKGAIWELYNLKKRPGTSILLPFPEDAIPSIQDQAAILCHQKCMPHLADLHVFLKALLTGLSISIEEVEFWPKNATLEIREVYERGTIWDTTDFQHFILRVTLKNGEAYALDITGAQSGWTEHILPWSFYAQDRIRDDAVVNTRLFGYCAGHKKAKYEEWGQIQNYILDERFNDKLNTGFQQWSVKNGTTMSNLHRLPDSEFHEKQSEFLTYMQQFLQTFKAYCIRARRCENGKRDEDLDAVPSNLKGIRAYDVKPGVMTEADGFCQMTMPDGEAVRVETDIEKARAVFEMMKEKMGW